MFAALQLPLPLEGFREGDQVNRAARLLQPRHFGKDVAVRARIKVVRNHALGNVIPALVIQH